jgi:hypothetical protein
MRKPPLCPPMTTQLLSCLMILACCFSTSGCGRSPTVATPPKSAKNGPANPEPKKSIEPPSEATEDSQFAGTVAAADVSNANAAEVKSEAPPPAVQQIHRPADSRPVRDDAELAKRGFVKLTSDRFILYSDLPKEALADLPDAISQLYNVLEIYFGRLPPAFSGKPYQMTGYLMGDVERFRAAKILAEGPAQPHEGWYLGDEFWWNRQATSYYTKHLMLHEATHCFVHVMPAVDCPPWYVEGMAELFGTHYRDEKGEYHFGSFPDTPERSPGWGRVSVLQDEIAAGRMPTVEQVLAYQFDDFSKLPPYAWSWALCHFLNTHPRYQVPFQTLAKRMMSGGFRQNWTELFQPVLPDLRDEWLLYGSQIQYGHDIKRSVIEFQPGNEFSSTSRSQEVIIAAARGWQSSRVKVIANHKYRIRATGRFTLATTTKPWISEAQGISIRYFDGQPLGRLLGSIRPEPTGDASNRDILKLLPLGPDTTFLALHSGTLYLRLNDAWNELADNSGEVSVEIQPAGE